MTYEQQQALVDHALHARSAVNPVLELYRAWRSAYARRELHALSDRMLKDIGLSRSEIDSLFR